MISTALSVILAGQVITAPRSLEVLPNGASLYVESMPSSDRVSVQLWVSSRGAEESPDTHGHRHLLEHMIARRLDVVVESKGMFLTAETTRSAMAFKVSAAPEQLDAAIDALRLAWSPIATSPQEIAAEVKVMAHEEALLSHSRRMSRLIWHRSEETERLDPFGTIASMAAVTPEKLAALQRRMFVPQNLTVSIAGSLETRLAADLGRTRLGSLPVSPSGIASPPSSVPEAITTEGVSGAGVGIRVDGLPARNALATIGFSLAASQALQDVTAVYQPSSRPGFVVLATTLPSLKARLQALEERQLFPALALVRQWVRSQGRTPDRVASFRGAMTVEGSSLTLQQLEASAVSLTIADIKAARDAALKGISTEGTR